MCDIRAICDQAHLGVVETPLSSAPIEHIEWRTAPGIETAPLPVMGFKLHLSASPDSATRLLKVALSLLLPTEIPFKVIGDLKTLHLLNAGLLGYSQAGKFITIYPSDRQQSLNLVKMLEPELRCFHGPRIPSDRRLYRGSVIHYRYGALGPMQYPGHKDSRHPHHTIPAGIRDPFRSKWSKDPIDTSLQDLVILRSLRQRPKGGVYLALYLGSGHQVSRVVVKEARRGYHDANDGIDTVDRLAWQRHVQEQLISFQLCPRPIELRESAEGSLLIMEYVGIKSLHHTFVGSEEPRSAWPIVRGWLVQLIEKLSLINQAGWWPFDLAPDNIRVDKDDTVWLVDLEHAIGPGQPAFPGWDFGSPGFLPPKDWIEHAGSNIETRLEARQIYALCALVVAATHPNWYKHIWEGKHFKKKHWELPAALSRYREPLRTNLSRGLFGYPKRLSMLELHDALPHMDVTLCP